MLVPDQNERSQPSAGPAFTSSVGRWRKELSAPEIAAVKDVAGPLLIELGYERDSEWSPETGEISPASAT
jgi:hypothetical protein